jgi:hypothetical protein
VRWKRRANSQPPASVSSTDRTLPKMMWAKPDATALAAAAA